ncbi:hypothetical protein SHIRM173S_11245 [Streptomyces hirsutus]
MVDGLVAGVRAFGEHPLFRKIVGVDPELLLPYVLDRRGASQEAMLKLLADALREGHADGSVRAGHPERQARSVLLIVHPPPVPADHDRRGRSGPHPRGPTSRNCATSWRGPSPMTSAPDPPASAPSAPPRRPCPPPHTRDLTAAVGGDVVDVLVVGLGRPVR